MNAEDFNEHRDSWIAERIAILIHDGRLKEWDAEKMAFRLWEKYRRERKIFMNEQGTI